MKQPAENNKNTLMKRRLRAIIISAIAIVLLVVTMILVLQYTQAIEVKDEDGTSYYIRKKDGVYALYDAEKNLMPTEEEFGYYVTAIGTLIRIDAETGEYLIIARVDTEYSEQYGLDSNILMFPSVSKENILSIEIHNSTGTFTFTRYNVDTDQVDAKGDFILLNSPTTPFDSNFFTRMYVAAGYTMTTEKVSGPADAEGNPTPAIKRDANWNVCLHTEPCACDYKEYGLAPCIKYDADGNAYAYEPAYYILTDIQGTKHKVIVGDMLVDKSGYYVQYVDMSGPTEVKRDTVYVIDPDMGNTMLAAVEDYVTPTLSYPMTQNTYFDVEDFTIGRLKDDSDSLEGDLRYDNIISFSYIDIGLRENTLQANFPYEFNLNLKGYAPNSLSMETCLKKIYQPEYVKVCKLNPSEQDLMDYGLYTKKVDASGKETMAFNSPYTISFKYDLTDENGKVTDTLHQIILISQNKETGNYYAYTIINRVNEAGGYDFMYTYNTILEISRHSLDFLQWSQDKWISETYINYDIAFIESIELVSPSYQAFFQADNSFSDMSSGANANRISVLANDSTGKTLQALGMHTFVDIYGSTWLITPTEILAYDAQGNPRTFASDAGYYEYNVADRQAFCLQSGKYITCSDKLVEVGPNSIYIRYHNGQLEEIKRYASHLFMDYYYTLRYASIIDDYPLSSEEEEQLIGNPDKFVASITLTTKDVDGTTDTNVYSFYRISAHKAYLTINGRGGFCVKMNRVNKFITDAQKFMNLEVIDPTAKY